MDQLKIVLEHKFWILSALAALLSPIGWWFATSDMAQQTKDRTGKIESDFKSVKTFSEPSKIPTIPNDQWIRGAKGVSTDLAKQVDRSHQELFDRQKQEMVMPEMLQSAMDQAKLKYGRDDSAVKNVRDLVMIKRFFTQTYNEQWLHAVNIIDPFIPTTGDGKVVLGEGLDPAQAYTVIHKSAQVHQWDLTQNFSAMEMWDTQEDLWLLRALMHAIANVNKGATQIGDAPIKQIVEIRLRGGSLTDLAERRKGTQNQAQQQPGVSPAVATKRPTGSMLNLSGVLGGGGGGGSGATGYQPPKTFDADDVFGSDGGSATAIVEKKKDGGGLIPIERYTESQSGKWKKRAFVMQLVMDERQIPILIGYLTTSTFPVEIKHVEHEYYEFGKTGKNRTQAVQPMGPTSGSEQLDLNGFAGTGTGNDDQQKKIKERLDLAFNQSHLATVILAGTFTIYDDPTKASGAATTGGTAPPTIAPKGSLAGGPANSATGKTATGKTAADKAATGKTAAGKAATGATNPGPAPAAKNPGTSASPANKNSGDAKGNAKAPPAAKSENSSPLNPQTPAGPKPTPAPPDARRN